jgi:integral membrane protein (TIGR01906 family)
MMTDRPPRPDPGGPRYDRPVYGKPTGLLIALIAAAVPLVILGNALLVLLIPWFAHFQYALPGFPDDPFGLAGGDRASLGATGIRSIWPVGPGTELLVDARLPDGSVAFGPVEVRHMGDVRSLVQACFVLWLISLTAGAAAAFRLQRTDRGHAIRKGLRLGSVITIGAMALTGLAMLVNFEAIFDGFHEIFFAPGTWTFSDEETLRRLYPDAFWGIASGLLAALALAQALFLWLRTRAASGP